MLLRTVQGGTKIIQQGWDDHLVISKPCPHLAQAANLDIILPRAFPLKNKSVRADGWEAGISVSKIHYDRASRHRRRLGGSGRRKRTKGDCFFCRMGIINEVELASSKRYA